MVAVCRREAKKFQKRFDGKVKSCEVTCSRRPRRAAGVIQDAVPVEWRMIFDIVKQALERIK